MDEPTNTLIFRPSHWELHPIPEGQEFPYILLHSCGIGECHECTISIPHEVFQSLIQRGVQPHSAEIVDALYSLALLEEKDETEPM